MTRRTMDVLTSGRVPPLGVALLADPPTMNDQQLYLFCLAGIVVAMGIVAFSLSLQAAVRISRRISAG